MAQGARIKDHWAEQRLFLARLVFALVFIIALAVIVVTRLVQLQVVQYDYFSAQSQGNRIRIQPVPPTRGLILDRNGKVLADNQASFDLVLTPEQVPDLKQTLQHLVATGLVAAEDLDDIREEIAAHRRFEAVSIRDHLSDLEVARYALNHDLLSPLARQAAQDAGLGRVCRNPFQSIVVRAVETVYAVDEALRILEAAERPHQPCVEVRPRAGRGLAATEAPRGLLHHTYELDEQGRITFAQIIPPTSQNQATIEADLRRFIAPRLHLPDDQLRWQCEQAVRNYDPCISCSTHFLKLKVERR